MVTAFTWKSAFSGGLTMETDVLWAQHIEDAVDNGKLELDTWEQQFLASVRRRLEVGPLSRKQRERLDTIHARIRLWP